MKHGVALFATDETIDVPQLAIAAEQRGFESFFLPEHTHIPASRRTRYAGGAFVITVKPLAGGVQQGFNLNSNREYTVDTFKEAIDSSLK